ncbi:MAG: hypothetical protein OEO79_05405 [Gemmatimonadota bacterium]|nr:hypothetical protein [Gemmatimonadota bacterium]
MIRGTGGPGRGPGFPRSGVARLAMVLLIMLTPTGAVGQSMADDPFAAQVVGTWEGRGDYQGNPLSLTRSWTTELLDQFLRADMRVEMANGFTFGAFMYWRVVADGLYEVIWMDGQGRSQRLQATRDPDSGVVSSTFLDELAEGGSEWRTWEFAATGPDAYVERLYEATAEGRELLAVFTFRRIASDS